MKPTKIKQFVSKTGLLFPAPVPKNSYFVLSKLQRFIQLLSFLLFVFLLPTALYAAGKHGKHEAEFMEITKWMEQNGFFPIDREPNLKASPAFQYYDYQWYDGSYHGSPSFQIFTYFDEKGLLYAYTSRQVGPDYSKSLPAQHEVQQRFYVAFNQWTQDSLHIVNKLYKDYAWEALGIKPKDGIRLADDESLDILKKYFDDELSFLLVKDAQPSHSTRA